MLGPALDGEPQRALAPDGLLCASAGMRTFRRMTRGAHARAASASTVGAIPRALLAAGAALAAPAARACPICHSPAGEQVRAGLLGPELLQNLAATLLPFPVLAAIVLLVRRYGLPGVPRDRDRA